MINTDDDDYNGNVDSYKLKSGKWNKLKYWHTKESFFFPGKNIIFEKDLKKIYISIALIKFCKSGWGDSRDHLELL